MSERKERRLEITFTFSTVLKLAGVAILIYAAILLRTEILLLVLAALIAVSLTPLLMRLERFIPRWISVALLSLLVGLALVATCYFVVPPVADQTSRIISRLPKVAEHFLNRLPEDSLLRQRGRDLLNSHQLQLSDIQSWMPRLIVAGQMLFGALTSLLFVYVFTIYFLIDGPRAFYWIVTFFNVTTGRRIQQTGQEIVPVLSAYVVGQVVTSALSFAFVLALLKSLAVPAALTLGVLAAIFDILPIVGFFLTIGPAIVFALTVSPSTAVFVALGFTAYHLFETYVITPVVYGRHLRLSGLSVLLGLLVGAAMGGIVGAIIVLPIMASYPIVERLWLKRFLGADVVAKHNALAEDEDPTRIALTPQKSH